MSKICKTCDENDPNKFAKCKSTKDGLQYKCKKCKNKEHCEWRKHNKDYNKNRGLLWRQNNPEYGKAWRIENTELCKQYKKDSKETRNARETERRKIDHALRIGIYLRNRLYAALKGNIRNGSAVRDLGCSLEELKTYLGAKFVSGMTWENHGKWHIDHIVPLDAFDLTARDELLKACHYTNLQPLWALDNLIKSNKV
jgi:hypothetical protein